MAVWQYDIHLIPREQLSKLFPAVPITLEREAFDATEWWEGHQLPPNYDELVTTFLPASESWDLQTKTWGDETSDRIDVLFQNKQVVDFLVRIDVRALSYTFLQNIVRFSKQCNCVLLTQDMRILEPDVKRIVRAIKASEAFRFVEDPKRFLETLMDST